MEYYLVVIFAVVLKSNGSLTVGFLSVESGSYFNDSQVEANCKAALSSL